MKFHGKKQCWGSMGCGKDRDGSCPTYPDYGRYAGPLLAQSVTTGSGKFMRRPSEIEKNAISLRLPPPTKEGKL